MRSSAPPYGRTADGVFAALLLLACVAAVAGCRSLPWGGSSRAPGPSPDLVEYRVKPGDTIAGIAAWHGVEPSEVRRRNGLDEGDALSAGRSLQIPARPLGRHRVARGETLGRIGQQYGTHVRALVHLNDVADVRRLQVGQEIRIPANAKRGPRPVASQAAATARPPAPLRPAVHARTASERTGSERATSDRAASKPAAPAASSASAATSAAVAPTPAPVTVERAPDRIAPPPARMEVDQALLRAAHAFDDADFDGALVAAERARRLLPAESTDPADRRRLARAHLLAGMAHIALDRGDEARRSIRTALALDETIQIDPDRASPTVAAAFRDAQRQ